MDNTMRWFPLPSGALLSRSASVRAASWSHVLENPPLSRSVQFTPSLFIMRVCTSMESEVTMFMLIRDAVCWHQTWRDEERECSRGCTEGWVNIDRIKAMCEDKRREVLAVSPWGRTRNWSSAPGSGIFWKRIISSHLCRTRCYFLRDKYLFLSTRHK
jgi:hypothetical protein